MEQKIGTKASSRRDTVIQAFKSRTLAGKHVTVDELFAEAKKLDSRIGYTTVWRALKLLAELGLASSQKFNDRVTRYEYVKEEAHHHDHLICIGCGKVEEFMNPKIEEIQRHVAAKHKFTMTSHKMELYGYCKKCKSGIDRKP